MARRSLRQSQVSETKSSPALKGAENIRKRARSSSQRSDLAASTGKSASKKSRYFKQSDDAAESDLNGETSPDASEAGSESDFEAAASQDLSSAGASETADDNDSSDNATPKRKQFKTLPKTGSSQKVAPRGKGRELWREGQETGLEPGTRVVIKKPKARLAGKTPYAEDTIHPNTLLFLGDLKANNDREWLKMHDPDFRASLRDFNSFIEELTSKLSAIDDTIPELPIKDIVFRIYRDIRFSPDPTPYKAHFSAAWSRTGRKGPYAAYYLQISKGNSFFGGGLWHPESERIAALRRDIDRKPHRLKSVLTDDTMRKEFLGGVAKNVDKAVKVFIAAPSNADTALKTKPKGYDANHRDIELLRLKSFTIGRKLSDEEVLAPRFIERLGELISCMLPFITYLNSVVMPDDPADSDGSGSGSGSEPGTSSASGADDSEGEPQ